MVFRDIILEPIPVPTAIPSPKPVAGDLRLWGTVILEGEVRHGGSAVSIIEDPDLMTETLDNGSFLLENLGEGPYTLEVSHPGFQTQEIANFTPFSATEGIGIRITLGRLRPPMSRGVLQGTATLEDQTNHEGTTIRLTGIDQTVMSDAEGRYIFVDIPTGAYVLEASHPGYKTRRLLGVEVGANIINEAPSIALSPITIDDLEGNEGFRIYRGNCHP